MDRVTPLTDVYALGVLACHCLTGEPLSPGGSVATALSGTLASRARARAPRAPSAVGDVIARDGGDRPALRRRDVAALALGRALESRRSPSRSTRRTRTRASGRSPKPTPRDFFGRDALVERLVAGCTEPLDGCAVPRASSGPSGSGKSSRRPSRPHPRDPQRRHRGLRRVVHRRRCSRAPHPIDELEAALRRASRCDRCRACTTSLPARISAGCSSRDAAIVSRAEVVLVVDQFEEVFTLVTAEREDERRALPRLARASRSRTPRPDRVIATLRADFYDRPLTYPRFGDLLAARTEAVPPLTADELEQAIRAPAERVGVRPRAGLVAEIDRRRRASARRAPAAAVRAHGAVRTAGRRDDHARGVPGHRRHRGRCCPRAPIALRGHRRGWTPRVRQVFLRLVTLGEGRHDTRRRVTRSELDSLDVEPAVLDEVLDVLGRASPPDVRPRARDP